MPTDNETKIEKTPAELQREQITSQSVNNEEKEIETEKVEDKENDDKEETTDDDGEATTDEVEEELEENEDAIKAAEKEKAEAKTKKEQDRKQKRIDKLKNENLELAKRVQELEAKEALKPDSDKVLTEDEVERRANLKMAQNNFDKAVEKLHTNALKLDKDFQSKVNEAAAEIGLIPQDMIVALDDLDNGPEVLVHVMNDPDLYEEIHNSTPHRRIIKLTKISDEIKPKTVKKVISKVPPPINPGGSSSKNVEAVQLNDKMDMATWVKNRNKQVEQKRKEGRLMLR